MANNLRRIKSLTLWMKKQGVQSFASEGVTVSFFQREKATPSLASLLVGDEAQAGPALTEEQAAELAKKQFEENLFYSAG